MKTIKKITVLQGYSGVDHLDMWVREADEELSGREFRSKKQAVSAAWEINNRYSGHHRDPRGLIEFTDGTFANV